MCGVACGMRAALPLLTAALLGLSPAPAAQSARPQDAQTIASLRRDTFGGGTLSAPRVLGREAAFTRHELRFTSDGLGQYGFLNVPAGKGPFPVVVVLHGYVNPARYRTLTYTTRYADALARAGFVVLHPDYRGHGRSAGGAEDPFRIGYARDVLNLLALVRSLGGKPGPLVAADPARIGLWGHSMGGGIAQRVAAVDEGVKAVLLYGAMSGDERRNARQIFEVYTGGARGRAELEAPQAVIDAVSPINFLGRGDVAWSVHHGTADREVPPAWSRDLCAKLAALKRRAECFTYAGSGHILGGAADATFRERAAAFFRRELR